MGIGQSRFSISRVETRGVARNSIFPGKEIGPNRVSPDKPVHFSVAFPPFVLRDSEKKKKKLRNYSNRSCYSFLLPIFHPISIAFENESVFRSINERKRREERRKREKGSVTEVIAPPHRIVTFRSGHQPDQMYSDCVTNGRSARISYANRCRE